MIVKRSIAGVVIFISVVVLSFFNLQQDATASRFRETSWTDTGMSMTELLDSGWKLIGHSTNRASTFNVAGGGVWDTHTHVHPK
jgi:hypothetical protein